MNGYGFLGSSKASLPKMQELPEELVREVVGHVPLPDLVSFKRTCRKAYRNVDFVEILKGMRWRRDGPSSVSGRREATNERLVFNLTDGEASSRYEGPGGSCTTAFGPQQTVVFTTEFTGEKVGADRKGKKEPWGWERCYEMKRGDAVVHSTSFVAPTDTPGTWSGEYYAVGTEYKLKDDVAELHGGCFRDQWKETYRIDPDVPLAKATRTFFVWDRSISRTGNPYLEATTGLDPERFGFFCMDVSKRDLSGAAMLGRDVRAGSKSASMRVDERGRAIVVLEYDLPSPIFLRDVLSFVYELPNGISRRDEELAPRGSKLIKAFVDLDSYKKGVVHHVVLFDRGSLQGPLSKDGSGTWEAGDTKVFVQQGELRSSVGWNDKWGKRTTDELSFAISDGSGPSATAG